MKVQSLLTLLVLLSVLHLQLPTAHAQGTTFTYQGRLNNGGTAANGLYDFRFRLYTDPAGSFQVGSNYLTNAVPTTNGLFTVAIDFGAGIFAGTTNWLEVGVRTNGVGTYTVLNPLQRLTPTPYAIFAETASNLSGVLPAAQLSGPVASANLSGTYGNAVNLNNAGNNFDGSFNGQYNGDGGGLTNLNAWALTGNIGTIPGVNFLGTADNQPIEIRVNNARAFRIEYSTNTPNIIGGWSNNFAAPGVVMATIGGGGGVSIVSGTTFTNSVWSSYGMVGGGLGNQAGSTNGDPAVVRGATVGGGANNTAGAAFSTIPGGSQNTIMLSSDLSQIGGGQGNQIQPGASYSVIGGGYVNQIQTNAFYSTVGGGYVNQIQPGATYSVIDGGSLNQIQTNAYLSTIGGGQGSQIQHDAPAATIAGGYYNSIFPNGQVSTIGGGYYNQIQTNSLTATIGGGANNVIQINSSSSTIGGGDSNQATNSYATVPGGANNVAGGSYSFAAGRQARALHPGAFVWSDSQGYAFDSTTNDEFNIRAQNGVRIQSDTGIHLNAGDRPLIVRDWDVFATNAPSYKAGIGRWGLFMEYASLMIGIPGDDLPGRTFQVAKYNTNGTPTTLMLVDQGGNVTANSFNSSGGSFSGNGSALTSVDAATLNGFSSSSFAPASGSGSYIQNQTAVSQAASFNIGGDATVGGAARITGLIRSGSETGTAEAPFPAGLVIRRINSAGNGTNNIVAAAGNANSSIFTLVRDGTDAGFQVKCPANAGRLAIACMGMDASGAQKNYYTNFLSSASATTFQIYSNAQNIVHFECTFGDPFNPSHLTQVTLTRWATDYFWMGNVNSTYNQ